MKASEGSFTGYLQRFAAGSCWRQILILSVAFFIGLCFAATISSLPAKIFSPDSRETILISSVMQALTAFIIPAYFTGIVCFGKESYLKEYRQKVSLSGIILVILLIIMIVPAMNLIIRWNEGMSLDSFPDLESRLRELEDRAAAATRAMLEVDSVGGMLLNVAVIGVLTGFAEEIFFRGALQRILQNGLNRHYAVWISAAVFSFIHFQFFGFVPRLLLGALFGYIFLWSGSIVPSSIAHATNNSLVVIFTWLEHKGLCPQLTGSEWFSTEPGWLSIVFSLVISAMILAALAVQSRNKKITL